MNYEKTIDLYGPEILAAKVKVVSVIANHKDMRLAFVDIVHLTGMSRERVLAAIYLLLLDKAINQRKNKDRPELLTYRIFVRKKKQLVIEGFAGGAAGLI